MQNIQENVIIVVNVTLAAVMTSSAMECREENFKNKNG
jgi:hypothetical protein